MCLAFEVYGACLLQDYRIDCTSGTYNSYRNFAYIGIVLWPIGFPLFCLAMLYYYKIPAIAHRKQEKAEWAAFMSYCMSMLADRGLPVLGITLDQTKWVVGGLTEAQMRQMLLLFAGREKKTRNSNAGDNSEEDDDSENTSNDDQDLKKTREEAQHFFSLNRKDGPFFYFWHFGGFFCFALLQQA